MYFNFSISFPYRRQKEQVDYFEKTYSISKNKSLEIQISKWGHSFTLLGLEVRPSWYQSHSGLMIEFELFNYSLIINLCDNRHWNYQEGRWYKEGEE